MSHLGDATPLRARHVCRAAKTEVVLLKGAALALTVYGSFVERPMSDVDLLVARGDAPRARDALLAAGWVSRVRNGRGVLRGASPSAAARRWTRHRHEPRAAHVALLRRASIRASRARTFAGGRDRVEVRGHTVLVPSVHDQLLHLVFALRVVAHDGDGRVARVPRSRCAGAHRPRGLDGVHEARARVAWRQRVLLDLSAGAHALGQSRCRSGWSARWRRRSRSSRCAGWSSTSPTICCRRRTSRRRSG